MIKKFILHRKITLFVLAILIAFGGYNYIKSPRQETPEIEAPVAMITGVYPGAGAQDIDQFVVSLIEQEIKTLQGYDYAYSYAKDNVGVVIVRLAYDSDIQGAWQDLRVMLQDLDKVLPRGCEPLQMRTDLADTAGMMVTIRAKSPDLDLRPYGQDMVASLNEVEGVSHFDLIGQVEENIIVTLAMDKLNQMQLTLQDLVQIIESQNIDLPLGKVMGDQDRVEVVIDGQFESLDDLKNISLGQDPLTKTMVYLKDIAKIESVDGQDLKIRHDGQASILAVGYFKKDINIVNVGKAIDDKLMAFEKDHGSLVTTRTILNQPATVDRAIGSFVVNLLQGVAFVILVVLVGMGLRNAIIVSTAIPSAIMITIAMMYVFGIELHQISIAALIVALGMLVDNAIVVSDAIQVRLDQGQERLTACVDGVKEVMIPILTSTLTTIAAFLPLLLLNSIAGEYISSLPMIVMIALLVSYVIAISVTPTMAYIFFRTSKASRSKHRIKGVLNKIIEGAVKLKAWILIIIACVFALTLYLGLNLGLQFFPYAETDMFYINIDSQGDLGPLVGQVEEFLDDQAYVLHYTSALGDGLPKFYQTMPVAIPSEKYGQIMVVVDIKRLKKAGDYDSIVAYIQALQDKIDKRALAGKVAFKALEQGEPIGAPIVVRLTGSSLEALNAYADKVLPILASIEGTSHVRSDQASLTTTYDLDLDRSQLEGLGLSQYSLQNEINIGLYGRQAGELKVDNHQSPIVVKSDIQDLEDLSQMKVFSPLLGEKIDLKTLYTLREGYAAPVLRKYKGDLSVTLYSDVKYGYSPLVIQDQLAQALEGIDSGKVSLAYSGEKEKIKENFGDVGVSAVVALVLVYLILLIQFNSFVQPFVILVTIPLSAFGSVVGLSLAKQPLSFTAILGMVSLLGIVVNNAIVLLDYINTERRAGKSVSTACYDAVDKRFRPIVLSTITTVIGLTPLVYSGGTLFVPMAISLISGLLVSMVLTLVVVPVIYRLFVGGRHKAGDEKAVKSLYKINVRSKN